MDDKQRARLQKLWDAKLVTTFYLYPHMKIHHLVYRFQEQHNNLSFDDFNSLQRTLKLQDGSYTVTGRIDTYRFVAQYLPKLYKILEAYTLEDMFDIVSYLSTSNIDTQPYQQAIEFQVTKRAAKLNERRNALSAKTYHQTRGKGSKLNVSFFRPS